jgi:hypothetical protein
MVFNARQLGVARIFVLMLKCPGRIHLVPQRVCWSATEKYRELESNHVGHDEEQGPVDGEEEAARYGPGRHSPVKEENRNFG